MNKGEIVELVKFNAARKAIALASSVDEVKDIRDKAEALRLYIKQQKGSLEMQNHCAEIKLRAERKVGDIIKKQPKNKGAATSRHDVSPLSLKEQGLTEKQSSRWQKEAAVPEKEFEKYIAEKNESKEEITQAGLLSLKNPHVVYNSGENEWYTPSHFIKSAKQVMGRIDLDPASSEMANKIVGAKNIFTKENNGLDKKWSGKIWMNPPYSKTLIDKFIDKLIKTKPEDAIVLVNNATETKWFQNLANHSNAICLPSGRIKFVGGKEQTESTPLQGQAILYIGKEIKKFKAEFIKYGLIAKF